MISEADIATVVDFVKANGLSEAVVSQLRGQFSDYHFTYCMDDDMEAYTPALESEGFNIYFVNSSDHCSKLTTDPTNASGFVLAEVDEDE
ncbi:DUF6129 family protein [Halioxenophilus sp. WMMB6]|uniref:DUF6129 family protein n=1 Tax=Halioxenophilus sp. WMMB6 TaxID=3073815 RepID=UPI00295E998C|nr:DUF6129 family protein [Halioxenophilus sp. WMMB6]